ncbi:MAG: hypothetical protein Q8P81_03305 [Nanoarchaeota archaeon]|nr:hypothetical protein [Nanoarchaeota archaeon]
MIECSLRKITRYPIENRGDSFLREGRYHGSKFNLEEKDRRVVGTYIEFDYKKWIGSNLGEEEIIKQCVEYLNVLVAPRKSKKNKKPKPYYKYGFLKPFRCKISKDKNNHFFIIALLTTNDLENKHFWDEERSGRGESDLFISSTSRRGRTKKT